MEVHVKKNSVNWQVNVDGRLITTRSSKKDAVSFATVLANGIPCDRVSYSKLIVENAYGTDRKVSRYHYEN